MSSDPISPDPVGGPEQPAAEPDALGTARAGRRRTRRVLGLSAGFGLVVLGGLVAANRMPPERLGREEGPAVETLAQVAPEAPSPAGTPPEAAPAEDGRLAAIPVPEAPAETETPSGHWNSALTEASPAAAGAEAAPAVPDVAPALESPAARLQTVPLPLPRPSDLSGPGPRRTARRPTPRRVGAAPAPAPAEDTRSFFDRLFGIERPAAPPANPPAPALAYAALESTGSVRTAPALPRAVPPVSAPAIAPPAGGGSAVYDITARTVTLPSGERLEAHSGLGSALDDPRFVHLRMRGPTPPGTYDLTEREQPFHGVRAIRMTPVGGSAAIHGRDGILAHTYMLGPSGASNGCVVFREYDRFLQAYLRGEIARLVVVTGAPPDGLPTLVKRLFGGERPTRVGSAE